MAREFDMFIFHETNIKKEAHEFAKYDDFDIIDMLGLNVFYVDQSLNIPGTLIAWDPEKVTVTVQKCHEATGFEIAVLKVEAATQTRLQIAQYQR